MDQSGQNGPNIPNWTDVDEMDQIDRSKLNWNIMDRSGPNQTKVNKVDLMD